MLLSNLPILQHPRRNFHCKFSSNNQKSSNHQKQESFPPLILHLTTSAILFASLIGNSRALAQAKPLPDVRSHISAYNPEVEDEEDEEISVSNSANAAEEQISEESDVVENIEDLELKAALESWKSKTFALTVPLRIVALRGSIPPSWIKEFISSQGRRLKFQTEFRASLSDIFKELSSCVSKGNVVSKSAMAADIITVGDSWLKTGIVQGIIEPIEDAAEQFWFKGLSEKWKVHLRRDDKGELDPGGKLWAVPYRWGTMVIAYKTNKFRNYNITPIEDWSDLWRPELAGKIAMVNSPREIIGSVLKYMGASYNTKDIDRQVTGGMKAVMQNLMLLQKQVKLFDSVHYLKAFGVGDVWVVVGWSNDVLPIVKRMSDVAVIVPKSGASLWADLWAIPAACKFETSGIGGRVRGPSPLIHQWIEFCLGEARALPFKQEVVPGASPIEFEEAPLKEFGQLTKGRPKLNTNLIGGVPPPEILTKCEFLEPLPESVIKDYSLLIDAMQKPGRGLVFPVAGLHLHVDSRIWAQGILEVNHQLIWISGY